MGMMRVGRKRERENWEEGGREKGRESRKEEERESLDGVGRMGERTEL